ncbi:MAG: flagellar basal body M-ring protein FliF [Gammaproteobacteria bacterium]|nr:flagellar basal body M-ring protein FliF [Gammaproteobacteria bacterium]
MAASSMQGLSTLPALRQVGVMIGLAASVALGVAVVLWSQTPSYSLLYGNLSNADASEVADALRGAGIEYKIEESTGALLVPASQVYNARLKLAKTGLPNGNGMGFELLDQEQSLGTSQFMENVRYQRALEGELARTIATFRSIDAVRVHLALPKRSVFLREQKSPSASVTLSMFAGRTLSEGQVASIVHLIASSVPYLEAHQVTVVNQRGMLLTDSSADSAVGASSSQLSYVSKLEKRYIERIRNLLDPLIGGGGVRAQVDADIDFTVIEKTQEMYNGDLPALRSEQVSVESKSDSSLGGGIAGAVANQPMSGDAPLSAGDGDSIEQVSKKNEKTKNTVRNYELDKTITHTRIPTGKIRKLSVAIVIDDKEVEDEEGDFVREPWNDVEIARFSTLIKEAVGFNVRRGDTLSIISAPFQVPEEAEPLPEPEMWEQPWFWDAIKQFAGAIGVLLLIFAVLKPLMRSLAEKGAAAAPSPSAAGLPDDQLTLAAQGQLAAPSPAANYDERLSSAKSLAKEDPKRVANVVKGWVENDG